MGEEALRPGWWYRQSAAAPVRCMDGRPQVLLVTSRSGKRWVVPKGIVEPGLTPAASAEKEAWEEAGVRGRLRPDVVGRYQYAKWGGICTVEVFVLDVELVADQWPERELRQRRWLGTAEAAELVTEPELGRILRMLRPLG